MVLEPEELPSRFYRRAVRQICTQYRPAPDADPDGDFHDYLRSSYEAEKARLAALEAEPDKHPASLRTRDGQFIFAAGLLAYGQLDVAEDLLDFPPPSGAIRNLALALKALLPLPGDLDPLQDAEGVRAWLRQCGDRLSWNEDKGLFVKPDDQR